MRQRTLQGPSLGDGIPTTSYLFPGHGVVNHGDGKKIFLSLVTQCARSSYYLKAKPVYRILQRRDYEL